jgi:hypothetical protein
MSQSKKFTIYSSLVITLLIIGAVFTFYYFAQHPELRY